MPPAIPKVLLDAPRTPLVKTNVFPAVPPVPVVPAVPVAPPRPALPVVPAVAEPPVPAVPVVPPRPPVPVSDTQSWERHASEPLQVPLP